MGRKGFFGSSHLIVGKCAGNEAECVMNSSSLDIRNNSLRRYGVLFLILIVFYPAAASLFWGIDGPVRVSALLMLGLYFGVRALAIRKREFHFGGMLLVSSFVGIVSAAAILTVRAGTFGLGAAFNLMAYFSVVALVVALGKEPFLRILQALRAVLVVGGFIAGVYIWAEAAKNGTFFVGLLRYDDGLTDYNLNHFATFLGLVLVLLIAEPGRRSFRGIFTFGFLLTTFIMLGSRTALLAFLFVLACVPLRGYSRWITGVLASITVVIVFSLLNIADLYGAFADLVDKVTSGRGRLWYFASDGGAYEFVSSLFENDAAFIERTIQSGHHTRYLHSTAVYYFVHVGVIGAVVFYLMSLRAIYVSLKLRSQYGMVPFAILSYLLVLGFGEQPVEFQKYGAIYFFIAFYFAMRKPRLGHANVAST